MIISHLHRFVFVEIPHTGSHSIAEQLIKHYGGQPILRKHANVTQFLAQATAEEKRYFKFATVRHPLDSATTDYLKLKNNHKKQFTSPKALLANGGHVTEDHLKEFRYIQSTGADFAQFFRTFRNRIYNNWFLVGDSQFDFVIRFEDLQGGFAEVLRRLGVSQQEALPHVNPTEGKQSYVEFYTPDLYQQAARCYGPFMKKWGYEFPAAWGDVSIPWTSQVTFQVLDRAAALAARITKLDPDNPFIHRAKKLADRVTSGRQQPRKLTT